MPPQRAEQLPAEARSFVNEFVPIHGEDVPPAAERLVARDREADASVDAGREPDAAARGQTAVGNRRRSVRVRRFDVRGSKFHYFELQTLNLRDHISGDRP